MLVYALLAALVGAALLGAAALKLADRTGTAVAAETFGLQGLAARWVWLPLVALEAGLAAGLLAAPTGAPAWVAAGVLAVFAIAQAGAIAAGRSGAPCGCFGARGHLSWGSVARSGLLAAAATVLALAPASQAPPVLASGLLMLALAAALVVRSRRPVGALEVAGEGPNIGARLDAKGAPLALFVADGCRLCRALSAPARRLGAAVYDEIADADAWAAAGVPGAPFAVALASDGTVLAKGTVNTRAQLASVVAAGNGRRAQIEQPERPGGPSHNGPRETPGADHRLAASSDTRCGRATPSVLRPCQPAPASRVFRRPVTRRTTSSRRSFLQSASAAVAAVTAGRMVGSLVAPGDADAFHFCGHIYTTDGCPHPTGLPRIDRNGFPLRAKDGKPVDDLGRLIDETGAPLDDAGAPLLDPDARPLPAATRTRVCSAAGKRYKITVRTDGAWYRCCNGHVRKLQDCCTTASRRINGDRGLRGYCYGRRKVFCVMYFQTKVPC